MNIRKLNTVLFIALILPGIETNLFSQAVKAEVNRDRIFIGEQIVLKLSLEQGKDGISWFSVPDSVNHFEVIKRGKIDTVFNGNYTSFRQTISITSFDSGIWQFPSLRLASIRKSTLPITIEVLPVDVSKMQEYNDIKEIEEANRENNWLITAIIATVTVLSIAAIYWLLAKRRNLLCRMLSSGEISLRWIGRWRS